MNHKRTMVTGGAGFIGSHLVERLLTDGHEVLVVDNFSTGRIDNLKEVAGHKNFHFVRQDILDVLALGRYFDGVDCVFHLAGLADIVPSIENPTQYLACNVMGTAAVLEASRQARVQRFIYTASDSSYGIPTQVPTPESESIKPQYPYALSKYLGEALALHYHQLYALPVVSLRLANVFGPRSRTTGAYGGVFGVFLAQKLHGKPYTVVGDGTQTRDYTYVTDVVDAFVRAAESDISGEVFNVGSGAPQSVNRLIELLGGTHGVAHLPKRPGEPDFKQIDTAKIQRMLGWKPRVSFEKGVEHVLQNLELWRDAPVWTPEGIAKATKTWFDYLSK